MGKAALQPQLLRDGCESDSVKDMPSEMKSIHEDETTGKFQVALFGFGCRILKQVKLGAWLKEVLSGCGQESAISSPDSRVGSPCKVRLEESNQEMWIIPFHRLGSKCAK